MNWRPLPFVAVLASASLLAQGVRLTRVPERVVLPAAAGQNLLVEVEVPANAEGVWLGAKMRRERVELKSSGKNTYQINLADPKVLALLPGNRNIGDLHVYAFVGNKIFQSAAIGWSRTVARGKVQCTTIGIDRQTRQASTERAGWLDPQRLARFEVRGLPMPQARAVVVAGSTTIPLRRSEDGLILQLQLTDGMRKSLLDLDEAGVEVSHGHQEWWYPFRIVPAQIDVEKAKVSVQQRRTEELPGTRGWLRVSLGDITGGQVLATVRNAKRKVVVPQCSLGEKEHVTFEHGGVDYVLVIDRLVNRLIGDDHAEVRVAVAKSFAPDLISLLIQHVGAQQDVTFVREQVDYDAAMARQFLRARRSRQRDKELTPERFIELASKSSRNDKPYHIRRKSGELVPAKQWFTEQLEVVKRDLEATQKRK